MNALRKYNDRIAEIKASNMQFAAKIAAIKAAREQCVSERVDAMMEELDYSKHDRRNNLAVVRASLTKYYRQCLDGIVRPDQFDDMFAHWSPYTGTY